VISNELCFYLSNYLSTQIFFMVVYLVFAIVYFNFFDGLPIKEIVNTQKTSSIMAPNVMEA
jgi:hypothetical protein